MISNNKLAIFLIIISVFCGTLMLTFLKLAQEEVNVYVAGFFRFLFGFLIIFPYMLKTKFAVFKSNHHKKHFLPRMDRIPDLFKYQVSGRISTLESGSTIYQASLNNLTNTKYNWEKNILFFIWSRKSNSSKEHGQKIR